MSRDKDPAIEFSTEKVSGATSRTPTADYAHVRARTHTQKRIEESGLASDVGTTGVLHHVESFERQVLSVKLIRARFLVE